MSEGEFSVTVERNGQSLVVFMRRNDGREVRFCMFSDGRWVVNQEQVPHNPVLTLDVWFALAEAVSAFLASEQESA